MDQALAECAKAEEAARAAQEETKRAIAVDGGSANIDSLKAAAEKADAAALKADETMSKEVDRIGEAAAAKLDKAAAQAEELRKELKEDPSDATAGVALGAAGLAGFLLLAGIGGPGAGVVGACGGALALLTFGSVPAEKQASIDLTALAAVSRGAGAPGPGPPGCRRAGFAADFAWWGRLRDHADPALASRPRPSARGAWRWRRRASRPGVGGGGRAGAWRLQRRVVAAGGGAGP